MQNLEVITLNIWQIVISLANLVIIFLILKLLLYAPVRKVMAQRQVAIDSQYSDAAEANRSALQQKALWDEKISAADTEAERIIKDAADTAQRRGDMIVAEAKEKADGIIRQAQADAALEKKKATAGIKKEIAGVSTALAKKMLGREISENDHRALIDSFIEEIGDGDDSSK